MTEIVKHFGALGVFALMVPEAACIPIPSELTLLFAGFAVGQGWLSFPLAVTAATAGNLGGSLAAYAVGTTRILDSLPLLRPALQRTDALLEHHGTRAVFIARLLPLARTFISLPAGRSRVPIVSFVLLTITGSALWAAGFVTAGVLAGTGWQAISTIAGKLLLLVGLAIAVRALRPHRP